MQRGADAPSPKHSPCAFCGEVEQRAASGQVHPLYQLYLALLTISRRLYRCNKLAWGMAG